MQRPRVENRPSPTPKTTSGPDIADLAAAYGLTLDPWQAYVLEQAMGEDDAGMWAAPRVGLSVARQNGKTAILEARELGGLLLLGEELIIHSAHEVKTALEAFLRMEAYFTNYDDLRKRVKRIAYSRGSEEIILKTGQRLKFMARSKKAGRGFSADCLILDEAQELPASTFQAIMPTLSARPNPQIWLVGTPPGPEQDGETFAKFRESALEGSPRLYYAEWSADPELSPDDPLARAQANPALGIRLSHEWVQGERESMSELGFKMERLGQWEAAASPQVIPQDTWQLLAANYNLTEDRIQELALAVDVDPARKMASVAVAALVADDRGIAREHVEIIQQRKGTGWLPHYIEEVVQRRKPRALVIDGNSPASSLIEPLRKRGILVTSTAYRQLGQACGQFYDACMEDRLRHADQPQLNAALAVARVRPLQDGAWAWTRKDHGSDITPLVAVTLALWGLHADNVARPKPKPKTKTVSTTFYSFA